MSNQKQLNPIQAAHAAQQQFEARFTEKLKSTPFPMESISRKWANNAFNALRYASIIALGLSPAEWNSIVSALREDQLGSLSLYEFACASNNLQKRTPDELGIHLREYGELMEEADELVVIWQGLSDKLRDEAESEVAEEMQMKEAVAKTAGMQPVKGDA